MPEQDPALVGGFGIEELVSTHGDIQLYRARDEHVDRRVLLRLAGEASAGTLLEDARRLAAVSHPGLVAVLGAGRSETGGYTAVQDAAAVPISEIGPLSSEQAARVAIDIAGAIEALSRAGLRAEIDPFTVLVARGHDGIRGLLDPLRAMSPGHPCLTEASPVASTRELADLVESVVREPNDRLRSAIDHARSGVSSRPVEFASALGSLATPRGKPGRRRPAIVAGACLTIVAAVGVGVVVHERSGGTSRPGTAAPRAPTARVVARIPLGLTHDELPLALAFVGRSAWVGTTAGRLLEVDTATNQLVSHPIKLGGKHPISGMVASEGKLYATDDAGWLQRIDVRTGRVTAQRHLAAHLKDIRAAAGVLWIASDDGTKGAMIRVDPRSLRPIGSPINALPRPLHIEVRGSRAWVLGGAATGQVVRLDAASGERKIANVGPFPATTTLDGGTLWIADLFDGTVSALDTERMVFTRPALQTPRSANGIFSGGTDLWVAASATLLTGPLRLERFDSRSGRHAGRAVAIGKGDVFATTSALDSLWVLTSTTLVRLAATAPPPPLEPPAPISTSPHKYTPGPLAAGIWRSTTFAAPFTFSMPAFAWIGMFPETDSMSFLETHAPFAELEVYAPRQVFATDKALRRVTTPAKLLEILRQNPRLTTSATHRVRIAGRSALQFELRPRNAAIHPEVCGPQQPCVLLFPLTEGTSALGSGDVFRLSLLRSAGRTLVIVEGGEGYDKAALAATASLLGTFHFKA